MKFWRIYINKQKKELQLSIAIRGDGGGNALFHFLTKNK